ncbi:hypothetical protein JJE00_02695 [Candidatus Bathyarchaeota archaeon]|nr:hypothetical protein [Candidatus Bathyarchaeota archaeon]
MKNKLNKSKLLFKSIFAMIILLVAVIPNVLAQDAAIVITSATAGGSVSPGPGTHTYTADARIALRATADEGYKFLHWIISGGYTPGHGQVPLIVPNEDEPFPPTRPPPTGTYDTLVVDQNPLFVVCGFGYTFEYNAVFVSTQPADREEAIVIVDGSVGGATNPVAGTYTFVEGSGVTITATPNAEYEFLAWRATGSGIPGHEETILMDNPLSIVCGLGYTYEYLPIFAPVDSEVSSGETVSVEYFYAAIIILAIIAVVAVAAALMYRNKK